jgi:hypothetical protein
MGTGSAQRDPIGVRVSLWYLLVQRSAATIAAATIAAAVSLEGPGSDPRDGHRRIASTRRRSQISPSDRRRSPGRPCPCSPWHRSHGSERRSVGLSVGNRRRARGFLSSQGGSRGRELCGTKVPMREGKRGRLTRRALSHISLRVRGPSPPIAAIVAAPAVLWRRDHLVAGAGKR